MNDRHSLRSDVFTDITVAACAKVRRAGHEIGNALDAVTEPVSFDDARNSEWVREHAAGLRSRVEQLQRAATEIGAAASSFETMAEFLDSSVATFLVPDARSGLAKRAVSEKPATATKKGRVRHAP